MPGRIPKPEVGGWRLPVGGDHAARAPAHAGEAIIAVRATPAALSLPAPTAAKAIERMMKAGMPRRATAGRRRHHLFACHRYPAILKQGTVPLPRCLPEEKCASGNAPFAFYLPFIISIMHNHRCRWLSLTFRAFNHRLSRRSCRCCPA